MVEPRYFRQGDGYASLLRDEDVVSVRPRDLLVRDDERLRFEAEVLPTLRVETTDFGDFTDFWYERPAVSVHADPGEGAAFSARRGRQWEAMAVREGGARRERLGAR